MTECIWHAQGLLRNHFRCVHLQSLNRFVWFYIHTTTILYVTRNNTLFFIQLLECYLPSPHPFSCTLHIFPFLYPPIFRSVCLLGLVQRCVIIQKDENGFGLTVSGDNPVFVQLVKEGKKDTNRVVHCPCFALHNMHTQSSFTSDLNTHLSLNYPALDNYPVVQLHSMV